MYSHEEEFAANLAMGAEAEAAADSNARAEAEYEVQYMAGKPDNVLAVLDQFATSSEGIAKFAHLVITEVEEGRVDPLRIALFMKTMEKIKETVNEKLSEYYVREAEKHPGKSFEYRGAEISIRENGGKYDFNVCGDPVWSDLKKIADETSRQMKEREEFLKAMKTATDLIVEGEGITVKPPVKVGAKMGIQISIK